MVVPSAGMRSEYAVATILVVCSANRCRSPMAAALLRSRLWDHRLKARVTSAGFGPGGLPVLAGAAATMAQIGLDIHEHRSTPVDVSSCAEASLVIGMTRQHVIELMLLSPESWARVFSLTDLVRRARQVGLRRADEHLDAWVTRVHGGRPHASVLALRPEDDIVDPRGTGPEAFERTRREIDRLIQELAVLLAGTSPASRYS